MINQSTIFIHSLTFNQSESINQSIKFVNELTDQSNQSIKHFFSQFSLIYLVIILIKTRQLVKAGQSWSADHQSEHTAPLASFYDLNWHHSNDLNWHHSNES